MNKLNQEELEKIYNNNFRRIYKFFYYKSQDKNIAQDLTSESFLSLAEYIMNDKPIDNPDALLYAIAKNVFNKYLKRKYQESDISIEEFNLKEVVVDEGSYTNRDRLLEKLKKFIKLLPDKQKRVMELRFFKKLMLKEVAQELGKDINYVKTTQRRAYEKLRSMIELET